MVENVVGDRADGKRALPGSGCVHVKSRRFHLDREHAHLLPAVVRVPALGHIAVVAIEPVGRQNVAHVIRNAHFLCRLDASLQHVEIRDWREHASQVILGRPVGVGASALSDDDVAEFDIILQRARRADAHDVLHAEDRVQLPGINADRRHAHTGGHDGNFHAVIRSGVALHTAHVVHEHGVFQEIFCDEFCAQGISGHQNRLAEVTGLGADMRGRIICHIVLSFSISYDMQESLYYNVYVLSLPAPAS